MYQNRRRFVKSLVAGGLLGVSAGRIAAGAPGEQRILRGARSGGRLNVLLLLTDDHGAHLECLGTRGIHTPHTTRLAGEGVLFRNAFSTCASCSPARSGILTGMYPHSNGHWHNTRTPRLPGEDADYGPDSRYAKGEPVGVHEDIPTLVELLNGAGYVTGITQKFHLSPVWKYPFSRRFGAGSDPKSHARAARDFFGGCGEKPFFLMANIGNTHRPFRQHIVDIDGPPVSPEAIEVPPNMPDTGLMRKDLAEYLAAVQCADACAGAVLSELRKSGRYERTLIIFTGDQGYCYHRAKATAYDAGIRVPMIISGPGVEKGIESGDLVSHVDLMPTILDRVGIDVPQLVQGTSLRPILENRADRSWRRWVFAEHNAHGPNPFAYYPIRSVFDGRLHYLRNLMPERCWEGRPESLLTAKQLPAEIGFAGPADAFPGKKWDNHSYEAAVRARDEYPVQYGLLNKTFKRPAEELYDLHQDPHEIWNLADDARYSGHLERLRGALDQWMRVTKDPGLKVRDVPRREG